MGSYLIEGARDPGGGDVSPGLSWIALVNELHGAGLPLNASSNAYANALRVKSTPGYLLGFTCYSSNVAAQFIQLFDTHDVPASGAVPVAVFKVAAASDKGVYFNTPGRAFKVGIFIVNSTTGPTYTAGAADTFFDAQFI